MKTPNCIVVLGPTASGKTKLAVRLAHALNGEVISMDSRQVYKGLDIGSGKDLMEYEVDGIKIPYHLISIAEAHTQFFLHHFIEELRNTFEDLLQRGKLPVLCGGTGLYLDALRKDFSFTQVPEDPELRKQLEHLDKNELKDLLHKFPEEITKHVDLQSKKRLVRGIEVARWLNEHPVRAQHPDQLYRPYYLGLLPNTETRIQQIRERLQMRIKNGLIAEARELLERGLNHERLQQLGLEYKFLSFYLNGELSETEFFDRLLRAIIQYSKRQMTWFRKMEKEGVEIHWLHPDYSPDLVVNSVSRIFSK